MSVTQTSEASAKAEECFSDLPQELEQLCVARRPLTKMMNEHEPRYKRFKKGYRMIDFMQEMRELWWEDMVIKRSST